MAFGQVLVNGVNYAWGNISFVVFGRIIKGITEVSYDKDRKKENNYGWQSEPISRGYGNVEYTASITLYREELLGLIDIAPDGDITKLPAFDIPVVFGGDRVNVQTDYLRAAEFTKDALKATQGDLKLLVTLPLIIAGVDHA